MGAPAGAYAKSEGRLCSGEGRDEGGDWIPPRISTEEEEGISASGLRAGEAAAAAATILLGVALLLRRGNTKETEGSNCNAACANDYRPWAWEEDAGACSQGARIRGCLVYRD
jgi:hypothetical protein